MLSILITIYNYNLLSLVEELHKQCLECKIEFEILTQDDASNSIYNIENEKINQIKFCKFSSLHENVGYRENKNLLVKNSKFENLLILDGDCILTSKMFIFNYLENLKDNDLVYGGRIHPEKSPSKNQLLRWKYGKYMEDQTVEIRKENPYRFVYFNNTLITKKCFNQIKFDSSFKKYGHDDTLFANELQKIKAKVKHIENPVQHNDIDSNCVFYNKMKGSLENLYFLYSNRMVDFSHSKMILMTQKLKKYKLTWLIAGIYNIIKKPIESNLTGSNPKLFLFNIFRLGYFCNLTLKEVK